MLKFLLCFSLFSVGAVAAPTDDIESLLSYIGGLEGASFVRNGTAHSPKEAEAHLRMKWTKQKAQIRTAEEFIQKCATDSSTSGKPYVIRFADKSEVKAADLLTKQLAELRGTTKRSTNGGVNASQPVGDVSIGAFVLSSSQR
ncbi:MAG: DUF5329 family protein [Opitutus sp.]